MWLDVLYYSFLQITIKAKTLSALMPCSYRSLYDADAGEGFLIYILIFKYFVITPVIGGDTGICHSILSTKFK